MKNHTLLAIGAAGGLLAGAVHARRKQARRVTYFDRPAPGARRTAVVTGASSGIGEAFARRLARLGYDLVLIARRRPKLEALGAEMARLHGIEAKVVVADLATAAGIADAARAVADAPNLELLISNAGFGTTGAFADASRASQLGMVSVHDTAGTQLAHAALPRMLARRRGGIVQVASIAAWAPIPGNAVYAASKRYLVALCQALQGELAGSGVYVQALCPGFTRSGFHDTPSYERTGFDRSSIPSIMWMTSDEVAAESLATLGDGRAVVIPGPGYRALAAIMTLVPHSVIAAAAGRILQRYTGRTTPANRR